MTRQSDLWERPLPAPPPTLRDYQLEAVALVEDAWSRGRRPIAHLATGSGKTVVAAELARREVERGGRVLFVAPRREIVHPQTTYAMAAAGLSCGVVMAGCDHLADPGAAVQIATVDTLASRLRRGTGPGDYFSLLVWDEAHLSITKRQINLARRFPAARLLGLTATPGRRSGEALNQLYDELVCTITVQQLIDQGHLVGGRYYSIAEPDLKGVGVAAGDYVVKQLSERVNQPRLVGDIVATWLERAGGRRTVVFCVSIEHSQAVCEQFLQAGVVAEHVDAKTEQTAREAIFARFRAGETQVLCNCRLASYGFDLPALSCVILARPTRSLVLYLQMVGRGLRPAEGKTDCLVLDHSGAVRRLGFAEDRRSWELAGRKCCGAGSGGGDGGDGENDAAGEGRIIKCPECSWRCPLLC